MRWWLSISLSCTLYFLYFLCLLIELTVCKSPTLNICVDPKSLVHHISVTLACLTRVLMSKVYHQILHQVESIKIQNYLEETALWLFSRKVFRISISFHMSHCKSLVGLFLFNLPHKISPYIQYWLIDSDHFWQKRTKVVVEFSFSLRTCMMYHDTII